MGKKTEISNDINVIIEWNDQKLPLTLNTEQWTHARCIVGVLHIKFND